MGDLLRRPFFAHVTVKNLELLRIDLLLRARDRRLKQILFPLVLPDLVKIDNARVGYTLDRRSETVAALARAFCVARLAFSKLIDDAPTCDLQEPSFKRPDRRIVF